MEIIIVAIIGACLGSFVTAASYRLPRNEDITVKRSHCTACKKPLSARDLIPILSWLINQAKCRFCKIKISPRYIIIEIIMTALAVLLFLKFGISAAFYIYLLLGTVLMVMIVVDFEEYIIPDSTTIAAAVLGFAKIYYISHNWYGALGGALACLAVAAILRYGYQLIKNKEGLGMGDVKFLPVAGLWVGMGLLPLYFILAGLLGVLTAIIWRVIYKNPVFPFGPALAVAMYILCVFDDTVRNFISI